MVIVRITHKGTLSVLRTSLASPQIAPLVMQLHAALVDALHAALPGAGFPDVRPPHCHVLRGIEPGGSRLTDLASAARMTKQSMGALVDHLEAAGYVERVRDGEDARVKAIRLTPRGRDAAEAIALIASRMEAEWAEKIGHRRLEQLREALAGITT
jgi:DNA-binding MarR family transcriptional regulator